VAAKIIAASPMTVDVVLAVRGAALSINNLMPSAPSVPIKNAA
jgi:hypothetical protein